MNEEHQKIIDRIRKLLRMKRGGTQAEIETALALAAELARKHGINLDSVNPDQEPDQPISHIDAVTSARISWECKYAGLICQKFFNVQCLLRRGDKCIYSRGRFMTDFKFTLIGTAWDTQIAMYVFEFLVKHFRRCWNTRSGRCRNRQAFLYGMYSGLHEKLEEQQPAQPANSPGLVLVERGLARRKNYMAETFGETKNEGTKPDGDAAAAKYTGYLEGRKPKSAKESPTLANQSRF